MQETDHELNISYSKNLERAHLVCKYGFLEKSSSHHEEQYHSPNLIANSST